mmetsp:Transcript_46425/g.143812  ORF Transcript_46425/g.143812 Transcript_46425/m.143812 type:complete len:494 (+) Transcript_46425:2-1483(+)
MATLLLISRSAAESDYREAAFWRSCSLQVQRLLGSAPLGDLARFVEAAAMVRHCDNELMYNFGDAASEAPDRMDSDALARALHAHAMLGFRNDRVLGRLQDELFELMKTSRATAGGLVLALRSLARLSDKGLAAQPSRELLDAVARMVTEHMDFFSVPLLCELLEAYGILRLQSDARTCALLAAVGGTLAKDSGQLSASNCAVAAQAFAKCRVHDERLLAALASRLRRAEVRSALGAEELAAVLYGFAKFTCQDTALLDLLSIEARRQLYVMDVPLVSSVLASLAKAGVSSPVLASRAAVQVRRVPPGQLDAASLGDLKALVMAFGKLQVRDNGLYEALAEAFLRRGGELFAREPCGTLVHISHALTKVHLLHPALFGAIAQALLERSAELSVQDVVKYLHGLAKVSYLPPWGLQEALARALQAEGLRSLGVFELLKLATAVGRLGLELPALEAYVREVLPHEPRVGREAAPPRRPAPQQRRRPSARRRKWSW